MVRNLEIIGETANNFPKAYHEQNKQIDWNQIIGMRHRIIHEYFGVDNSIIWFIVQNDIPALKHKIQKLLSEEKPFEID